MELLLQDLRVSASDPQRVYSCIVRMHDALATQPLRIAVISRAATVALLQDVLRLHRHHEEIQWFLCRVLTLACSRSPQFQCQAGQLALWNDVFELRSAHPESTRVLMSSLELYEALLRGNELHVLTTQPARSLIHELIATIDRFASSDRITCTAKHPEMVVAAVRVLAALYASPRLQALVEEKTPSVGAAVAARLRTTSATFVTNERDVTLFLRLCQRLVQQHCVTAVCGLFLAAANSSGDDAVANDRLWYAVVVDTWATSATVMSDFAALLTLAFAVPHDLSATLAESLCKHGLLGTLCELLARHYGRTMAEDVDAPAARTRLELVRAIRHWSAAGSTLTAFADTAQVATVLVPTLAQLLCDTTDTLRQQANARMPMPSGLPQQTLLLALETSLLLQQLHTAGIPSSALTPSVVLQMRSKLAMLKAAAAAAAPADAHHRDTDLDALVTRELTPLERLLRLRARTPVSATVSLKQLAGSKQRSRPMLTSSKQRLFLPPPQAASSRLSPTATHTLTRRTSSSTFT